MFPIKFSKVQQLSNSFSKKRDFIKRRTNLTVDRCRRLFQQKAMFLWEKLWLFGLFSEEQGDYIDVSMIKITIKTNQTDMDVGFFQT